ncbi:energy transducer TonB [Burkholderia metallica]|uniref:Energy transducer TonB n=2 Tax=Burkholderia metallica TaxID=488729 RepID=A0ABT8PBS1_9BURK|nr:energy transducer TonB [Burkholderia metallica]AOJ34235.1 energy transducer TonB [Burkholderia metallica]MCA7996798.1 energy transducer TonB [Burkholderia metallica]MDN7932502.1 energy transducer TonB [Burkholderia metallica]
MTGLTIEYGVPPARRHAARAAPRAGANGVAGRAAAATRPPCASPSARPDATKAKPGAWRVTAAIALAVTALHAGVALLAARVPAAPPVQPPRPLPMTVELTRPPEPLPQTAHPPPPAVPPKPPKQAPTPPKPRAAVAHPAPVPAAAPQVTREAAPATAAPAVATQAAPALAPAAPAAPVRETAPVGDAAYLRNPAPDYPAFAQDQGWEGRVVLRVHVLASGSPDSVEVRTSSGRRMLDTAAVAAVKRWTFVPAKRGDEAVDGWVNVPIDFKLG